MASITITGNAIVVKSTLTPEQIALVAKYRPEALVLFEGEGKDRCPVFAIGTVSAGTGSINKVGACFPKNTTDPDGKAVITLIGEFGEGDVREQVADKIGKAILNLNTIEAALPAVIEEIEEQKAAIIENITVG